MAEDRVPLPVTLEPGASMPGYATEGAVGMDLRCLQAFQLDPMQRMAVPTGVRVAIPEGFEGQVRPRSGLAFKFGISIVNAPGTIDSDYRGEIKVLLINLGEDVVKFEQGERIAQLVLCPVARAHPVRVQELEDTTRGEAGFGSTGRS